LLRLAGVPLASIRIAANKAYTSARGRKPSHAIGKESRNPIDGFDVAYFGDPQIPG
jgi:glc operon protein GlcG